MFSANEVFPTNSPLEPVTIEKNRLCNYFQVKQTVETSLLDVDYANEDPEVLAFLCRERREKCLLFNKDYWQPPALPVFEEGDTLQVKQEKTDDWIDRILKSYLKVTGRTSPSTLSSMSAFFSLPDFPQNSFPYLDCSFRFSLFHHILCFPCHPFYSTIRRLVARFPPPLTSLSFIHIKLTIAKRHGTPRSFESALSSLFSLRCERLLDIHQYFMNFSRILTALSTSPSYMEEKPGLLPNTVLSSSEKILYLFKGLGNEPKEMLRKIGYSEELRLLSPGRVKIETEETEEKKEERNKDQESKEEKGDKQEEKNEDAHQRSSKQKQLVWRDRIVQREKREIFFVIKCVFAMASLMQIVECKPCWVKQSPSFTEERKEKEEQEREGGRRVRHEVLEDTSQLVPLTHCFSNETDLMQRAKKRLRIGIE